MFGTIPKDIYDQMYEVISEDSSLTYLRTKQRGFYPRDENVLSPTLYPWVFMEFGGYTSVEVLRMPRNWKYEFTINVVAMVLADRGRPDELVFASSEDTNRGGKGIGDVVADICGALWPYHETHFNVSGVVDWNFSRVGTPSVMSVQALLVNPYIRGVQIDVTFLCQERDS